MLLDLLAKKIKKFPHLSIHDFELFYATFLIRKVNVGMIHPLNSVIIFKIPAI